MSSKSHTNVYQRSTASDASSKDRAPTKESSAQYPRRIRSTSVILGLLLNILITACPLYFIVFAILAYRYNRTPSELAANQNLLQAAIYGPTIFPVVFAAVVGRFLKSLADYKLEHGSTLATIEYLLASRTVSGVLTAPLRFRVFRLMVLPLIVLWALSPLGSQASLRLLSTTTAHQNSSSIISYLDISTSQPLTQGNDASGTYINAVNAAFNAALYGPVSTKDASQDIYGHVKIPMLEAVRTMQPAASDKNGWYTIPHTGYNLSMYSSLTGLPCSGIPGTGNVTFAAETSYFSVNCSITANPVNSLGFFSEYFEKIDIHTGGVAWNGGQLAIAYDLLHYNQTSRPRNLTLWSLDREDSTLSVANCELTTTYVEAQVGCNTGQCNVTAIRNSTLSHLPKTWSVMDPLQGALPNAFNYFVNTSAKPHIATSSPIELYLSNPRIPIMSTIEIILGNVDAAVFSQRLAQLLNSYWMITLSPDAALGKDFTIDIDHTTGLSSTLGTVNNDRQVLYCDKVWLAVLLLASLAMLAAGTITAVLDAWRKGPDIIDLFVSTIRDNPYASLEHHSSLEDGSDQIRRLRDIRVYIGDVQPLSGCGYIAIAAPDMSMEVESINHARQYR